MYPEITFSSKAEANEFLAKLRSAGIRCGITVRDGRLLLQVRGNQA